MLSQPGDASERDADHAAAEVVRGGSARPMAAAATIQRAPLDAPSGVSLLDNASPMLASAAGSTTLDNFDTGKSELKPAHKQQLADTVRNIQVLMRQYPESTVAITGYADTVDTQAKNLALDGARAVAVRQAMVDMGISDAIVATDSKGEGQPQVVKTPDETSNVKNRRVEVRFNPKRSDLPSIPSVLPPLTPSVPAVAPSNAFDSVSGKERTIDRNYHQKIDNGRGGPVAPSAPPFVAGPLAGDSFDFDAGPLRETAVAHSTNLDEHTETAAREVARGIYLRFHPLVGHELASLIANKTVAGKYAAGQTVENPTSIDLSDAEIKHRFPDAKVYGPVPIVTPETLKFLIDRIFKKKVDLHFNLP